MPEIANFVNHGAATITPAIAEKVFKQLPQWKLEFLADAVEDTMEGAYKDLPYCAVAQAIYALLYAHKKVGIIPDSVLNLGRADDSSIVRAVLIQNEKAFAIYAASQNRAWSAITSAP